MVPIQTLTAGNDTRQWSWRTAGEGVSDAAAADTDATEEVEAAAASYANNDMPRAGSSARQNDHSGPAASTTSPMVNKDLPTRKAVGAIAKSVQTGPQIMVYAVHIAMLAGNAGSRRGRAGEVTRPAHLARPLY